MLCDCPTSPSFSKKAVTVCCPREDLGEHLVQPYTSFVLTRELVYAAAKILAKIYVYHTHTHIYTFIYADSLDKDCQISVNYRI